MRSDAKKLFKVTLRGQFGSGNPDISVNYVIAMHPTEAYEKVYAFLENKDYGFDHDRELDKVELIAENHQYTDTKHMLFI